MYIEPNTEIRILKECPLDTTYEHTIFFSSPSDQEAYFKSLTKFPLDKQSYQRVKRGYMRVAIPAEKLYDCNYLMFKNTGFESSRWFYAFIKSVEYVNNTTSEIEFELDVMQTWYWDYDLQKCFVEREHSATDNIGDNLVPESLELGEYVADYLSGTNMLAPTSLVVASTFKAVGDDPEHTTTFEDVHSTYYGGMFSGLHYTVFPNNQSGAEACGQFIASAGAKSDGIVSVFIMPTIMITEDGGQPKTFTLPVQKSITSLGSYHEVKNNKLFTYPYNFLYVTNLQGNGASFRYEFFNDSACNFTVTGTMNCTPEVVLAPNNYKGVSVNLDEKMTLGGYPQLPFNTDTFRTWLSQNALALPLNALSTTLTTAQSVSSASAIASTAKLGSMASATAGVTATFAPVIGAIAVAGILAQVSQHYILPDQSKGGAGSQTLASMRMLDYAFMNKHITPEFAEIIDGYFSLYGYATHKVKVPNRAVRPYWTYTKTVGCVITGSIPCDDANKICGIYDKGITFWRSGANVGKYHLDNRPSVVPV